MFYLFPKNRSTPDLPLTTKLAPRGWMWWCKLNDLFQTVCCVQNFGVKEVKSILFLEYLASTGDYLKQHEGSSKNIWKAWYELMRQKQCRMKMRKIFVKRKIIMNFLNFSWSFHEEVDEQLNLLSIILFFVLLIFLEVLHHTFVDWINWKYVQLNQDDLHVYIFLWISQSCLLL